jgi:hypothetical protein
MQRIEAIEERNARVEADKAWETSVFRISSLAVIVYVVAVLLLLSVHDAKPILNALIPAAGFLLSVQTLPFLKKWWLGRWRMK